MLADATPLKTGGSSQSPALAPPTGPDSTSATLSALPAQEETVTGSLDDKKQKKHHSLFGLLKKKGDGEMGATASSTRTVNTSAAAGAAAILSKSLPPPPPPPKSDAQTVGYGVAPKPPAKDLPGQKPFSPLAADKISPVNASITSSGVSASFATGSNHGAHHVQSPSSSGRSVTALPSSPPMLSPAGSQIFERDVQESNSVLMPGSPAIPSHITTENFIPPVLDASSEAITDDHLDPNTVEIITHTHHQPAAMTVAGIAGSGGVNSSATSGTLAWGEDMASSFTTDKDDSASNYGSFDTTDIRRLSFISFADVVQAEQQHQQHQQHQQQHQQSAAGPSSLAGLASLAASGTGGGVSAKRSPSPIRSPARKSVSVKNLELSPQHSSRTLGSPTRSPKIVAIGTQGASSLSQVGSSGSEISVETMSQALRRTCSSDFGVVCSTPQSPA
ncbi:hypothetical protein SEPCBS57363_002751 [Sporothrix epigloea]|uniref:Uncharacterized protein n=1 Tax=Sporothrix epigloea TaxID=1892477 RepID=A0ABP0DHN2_9PEZI